MQSWIARLVIFSLALVPDAAAEPLKVLTTRAIATVLAETGTDFERLSGHRLSVSSDVAIRMVRRIREGESFDVLVASPEQIDALIEEGKISAATRVGLARSGIGVEVRAGAPKPDVSTVAAFKRALLNAESIAYLKEGQSGVYLDNLFARLGLTDSLKPKAVRPDTDTVSVLVANGEVEIGLVVITQILTTDGVDLVGPLPADIQSYVVFSAGVSSDSKAQEAARMLLKFLTGPQAKSVMHRQGMEPWPAGSR